MAVMKGGWGGGVVERLPNQSACGLTVALCQCQYGKLNLWGVFCFFFQTTENPCD